MINFGRGVPSDEMLEIVLPYLREHANEALSPGDLVALRYATPDKAGIGGFRLLGDLLLHRFPHTDNHSPVITNGGLEMVVILLESLLSQSSQPVLLTEAFSYNRVIAKAQKLGFKVLGIPFGPDKGGVDLGQLEATIQRFGAVAFYQVAPWHNPAGFCASTANLQGASRICRKYGAAHMIDMAYYEMNYEGDAPCYKVLSDAVICGSLSKTVAPGIRVGFGLLPQELKEAFLKAAGDLRISPSLPMQVATAGFIASGAYDDHLLAIRDFYKERAKAMNKAIAEFFPESLNVPCLGIPAGGGFAVVYVPGIVSDEQQRKYREHCEFRGVVIEPPVFRAPVTPEASGWLQEWDEGGSFVRVTFLSVEPEEIRAGLQIMKETQQEVLSL